MIMYLVERYAVFHEAFRFGWAIWTVLLITFIIYCFPDVSAVDEYKGQKIYYGILILTTLFLIGVVGTFLLPSPELFKTLIGG